MHAMGLENMDDVPYDQGQIFFEGLTHHDDHSNRQTGIQEKDSMQYVEPNLGNNNKELQQGNDDELNKDDTNKNNGRSDSLSDCIDLEEEKRMRKELNDRLYALRTLVPVITNLDRATILVDAIAYVKQLQKQLKELQHELAENSDDDGVARNNTNLSINGNTHNIFKTEANGFCISNASVSKPDLGSENSSSDKGQQMEVFCEHRPGGFVRLMEALSSLGLQVTNANVTSRTGLLSNLFNVKKRDSEMVQAGHLRDSLLELMRNPARRWPENVAEASESVHVNGTDQHSHHEQPIITSIYTILIRIKHKL